ncbi:MAG: M20 family metallopeptidase [Clostridiaceae bacterium]|nr:M20 family metallopeptidase [Clostridiaceae bacterium]
MNKYLKRANELVPELVENRRHFHRHPEVRDELYETVKYVKARLLEMGYEPKEICKCGLVAIAGGKKPGKCILIRGDMDALPMPEDTGLPFSSENPAAMHSCGHDFHMSMLLGAAKILKEHEDEIEGTIKICFQPNEETFGGAKAMIEAGVLENPHVDAAFAIHIGPMADVGTLDFGKGLTMGSADGFEIIVHGKGCHGAAPHKGIDPINIGVHIHLALQELLAREVNPAEQCTLTVGSMIFGDGATNVIPAEGRLLGTMRGFNAELIDTLRRRLEEVSIGTAQLFGGSAEIKWLFSSPAMYCDPDFTDDVVKYATDIVGAEMMIPKKERATGSEDFAYFGQTVPSQIFWLGGGIEDKNKRISNHNPKVLFSEDALPIGAAVYAQCAIEWLKEHK